jgi:hypothetical protein
MKRVTGFSLHEVDIWGKIQKRLHEVEIWGKKGIIDCIK